MAQKQEIEVYISEDGYIKYHIKGIKGSKCLEVGKALAAPVGEVENIELNSEYYEEKQKEKNIAKQKLT
jgi:hypothetical protein